MFFLSVFSTVRIYCLVVLFLGGMSIATIDLF